VVRTLRVDPRDAVPIWSQIEEGMRWLVASGAFPPGAPVPSVRDLARELRVNPATVAKAYQRLTEAGVFVVRRGDGTYVAAAPPAKGRTERIRVLREAAERYASAAATIGVGEAEAASELAAAWRRLSEDMKGRIR
jgi:GntR family transcriptional regulator